MQLQSILSPERTLCRASGNSKKRVLENAAHFLAENDNNFDVDTLFNSLIARERLGSTGLGNGIAIPHSRLANCDHITGCLISLEKAVDFDAIDRQPVDLLFVLLVPEQANDDHLTALAKLAELFSDAEFCAALRRAEDSDSLYQAAISKD